jgi:hypothetical protein
MANLVDQSEISDGWLAYNRGMESSGAGHTSTQNVFWNTSGSGAIASFQFGYGYIIGTNGTTVATVSTSFLSNYAKDTAPTDYTEGIGSGASIYPTSLYLDQLKSRLDRMKREAIYTDYKGTISLDVKARVVVPPGLVKEKANQIKGF